MTTRSASAAVATTILALCAVPVAWWLVGDLSSNVESGTPLDRLAGPWEIPSGVGIAALVLAAGCVGALGWCLRAGLDRRWCAVIAVFVLIGTGVGFALRVVTAGVIGANIGAGLLAFVGGPLAVIAVAFAVWYAVRIVRTPAEGE